jgi:hypothetical protein
MIVEMNSVKLNDQLVKEINKRYRDNIEINDLCLYISSKLKNN